MVYDLKSNINSEKNYLIDLRSDTVTKPSAGMRSAMADAEVGDDVYGDDPSINRLEKIVAERLGKESGIFMTSGTQSNLSAILTHCARGEEVIVGNQYHVFIDEAAGASVLGGVALAPIDIDTDKSLNSEKISAAVKPDDPHCPISKLLSMENTVSGKAIPLKKMQQAKETARKFGLSTHLDGARFFNATTELNCSAADLSDCADTVSVCLSKGLGSPAGSVLALPKELSNKARRWRKMLGGAMRQAGIIAAAGIFALENNIDRLKEDHQKIELLAKSLQKFCGDGKDDVKIVCNTNMLFLTPKNSQRNIMQQFMLNKGIIINEPSPSTRIVMHLDISDADLNYIIKSFEEFLENN